MKTIKSQVLSTRVPSEVINTIDDICKNTGVNRSQWLAATVAAQQSNRFIEKSGTMQARTMPLELQNMLTAAGVATVGILSYNLVNTALADAKKEDGTMRFSHNETQFISIITALGIAMAGYGLIKTLLDD